MGYLKVYESSIGRRHCVYVENGYNPDGYDDQEDERVYCGLLIDLYDEVGPPVNCLRCVARLAGKGVKPDLSPI